MKHTFFRVWHGFYNIEKSPAEIFLIEHGFRIAIFPIDVIYICRRSATRRNFLCIFKSITYLCKLTINLPHSGCRALVPQPPTKHVRFGSCRKIYNLSLPFPEDLLQ